MVPRMSFIFEHISFSHIYTENNTEADSLDKATVETEAGKLIIGIYKGEHHYNSSIGFYGSHL